MSKTISQGEVNIMVGIPELLSIILAVKMLDILVTTAAEIAYQEGLREITGREGAT
jgi:hypothetical protein